MTWLDRQLLAQVWSAVGGTEDPLERVSFDGPRVLSSPYPVADLAAASIGVAGVGAGGVRRWLGSRRR